jgi:hypothetical protein
MRKLGDKNRFLSEKDLNNMKNIQLKQFLDFVLFIGENENLSPESKRRLSNVLKSYNLYFNEVKRKEEYKKQKLENAEKYSFIDEFYKTITETEK